VPALDAIRGRCTEVRLCRSSGDRAKCCANTLRMLGSRQVGTIQILATKRRMLCSDGVDVVEISVAIQMVELGKR